MFNFTKDCFVGIINIDKKRLEYFETLNYALKDNADEEEYMASINYEGLDAQKRAHTKFVEKIENINLEDLDDNQDEYLNGILSFLLDWLANHILKVDKLIPCK